MFSGDGPAMVDAEVENANGEINGYLLLSGNRSIVENDRMKIAVARMEDIGNAETRCSGHALDFFQNDRQFGTWNNAVLDDIVGRETSCCGEGCLATLPHQKAFVFALGESIFPCAVCPADLANLL